MSFNEIVGFATAFVLALTAFVAAIARLAKSANEAWAEINKLKQGILSANAALTQINQRSPDSNTAHVKPDPLLVYKWAQEHRAINPYDMGPNNWERCLYDLGYPGGKANELLSDSNGNLKYQ